MDSQQQQHVDSSTRGSLHSRNFSPSFTEATGGMSGCHLLCSGVSCSHGAFFGSTDMVVLTIIVVYVYGEGQQTAAQKISRHFVLPKMILEVCGSCETQTRVPERLSSSTPTSSCHDIKKQ